MTTLRFRFIAIVIFFAFSRLAVAQSISSSHKQAAETFLSSMNMEKTFNASVEAMIDVQIKANPSMQDYADVLKEWAIKYVGWQSLKADMVQLYASEFSEKELLELAKFYKTPIGQKMLEKQPVLMQKGAEIGRQKGVEHTAELQEMIRKKQEEKKD